MPNRKNKAPGNRGVIVVMLMALLGAAGFAAYVRFAPNAARVPDNIRQERPDDTLQPKEQEDRIRPRANSNSTDSSLLVPALVNNDIQLGKPAGAVPDGVKPEIFIVNQTLAALEIPNAKATGIDIRNRVAFVDFTPALQKGYGTIEEGNLLKALQMALGQFKGIDKIQIIIEGKPVDSLGNVDLTPGLDVIRPGQSTVSNSSEAQKEQAPN